MSLTPDWLGRQGKLKMQLHKVSHCFWMCLLFDKRYAFPNSKGHLEQLGEDYEDGKYILQHQWVPVTVVSEC